MLQKKTIRESNKYLKIHLRVLFTGKLKLNAWTCRIGDKKLK